MVVKFFVVSSAYSSFFLFYLFIFILYLFILYNIKCFELNSNSRIQKRKSLYRVHPDFFVFLDVLVFLALLFPCTLSIPSVYLIPNPYPKPQSRSGASDEVLYVYFENVFRETMSESQIFRSICGYKKYLKIRQKGQRGTA